MEAANRQSSQPDVSPPKQKLSRLDWLWVAGAIVAAMVPRFLISDWRGFWLDEFYTLRAARNPLPYLLYERFAAGHFPLPFIWARLFHEIFGDSLRELRLSSIVACGAAIPGCALLIASLGLKRCLRPMLVMAVILPYWIEIGTEFRYMMPLVAVGSFFSWAVVSLVQNPGRVWEWSVILLGGVMLGIHASAQFIWVSLLAFGIIYLCRYAQHVRREGLKRFAMSMFFAFAFSFPILLVVATSSQGDSFSPDNPDPIAALRNQVETFFGDSDLLRSAFSLENDFFVVASSITYFGAIILVFFALRRDHNRLAGTFLASVLLGIPVCVMVTSIFDNIQGPARYVSFASVPLLLLMAIAWVEAGRNKAWGIVWQVFFVFVTAVGVLLNVENPGDWQREAVKWVSKIHHPQEQILTVGRNMNNLAFEYYDEIPGQAVAGLPSTLEKKAPVKGIVQRLFADNDSGFIFLYHAGDVPMQKVVEELHQEGFFFDYRLWWLGPEVRVIAVARTREGVERIQDLPDPPMPKMFGREIFFKKDD